MIMKKAALLLLCLTLGAALHAKKPYDGKSYHITLIIEGNTDSVMYLGNYYAGGTYAIDTAWRDKKGRFVFAQTRRRVFPGLYFFTNPGGRHVDFVIYNETPDFTFTTRDDEWTVNMRVKGSKENELFFDYHRLNARLYATLDSAAQHKTDDKAFDDYRHQMLAAFDEAKLGIIAQHPNSFVSLMMNATRDPQVPRVSPEGDTLSRWQAWEYYMDHYFDHMRLDDDAIVRTPEAVFKKRVLDYLDRNLQGADAETMIVYIDKLIARARPSKEAYKWLVHTITEKYLQSNVMSYDAIYVHMIKTYYAEGNYWSSPSSIETNVKRAEKWDRLLLGRNAIDLILKDDQGTIHQLYAQRHKYTLLVFWSPTCGHCKTVIPALYEKFLQYKERYDVGAFTILSEPDDATIPLWRQFIENHSLTDPKWIHLNGAEANVDWHDVYDVETTPQIYLLDKDKKIVGKKLNAETFELILQSLEGQQ